MPWSKKKKITGRVISGCGDIERSPSSSDLNVLDNSFGGICTARQSWSVPRPPTIFETGDVVEQSSGDVSDETMLGLTKSVVRRARVRRERHEHHFETGL